MLVAIKPIHDVCKIKRINVCTYQAVSGSGNIAIEELNNQVNAYVKKEKLVNKINFVLLILIISIVFFSAFLKCFFVKIFFMN